MIAGQTDFRLLRWLEMAAVAVIPCPIRREQIAPSLRSGWGGRTRPARRCSPGALTATLTRQLTSRACHAPFDQDVSDAFCYPTPNPTMRIHLSAAIERPRQPDRHSAVLSNLPRP